MIHAMAMTVAGRRAVQIGGGAIVALAAIVLLVYGMWAGYLAVFASEGSVPPLSRVPDLPAGVKIVDSTTECASGGCWREVSVSPAPDVSPRALAEELGIDDTESRYPWRLDDPHTVQMWAEPRGDHLVITLRYWGEEFTP